MREQGRETEGPKAGKSSCFSAQMESAVKETAVTLVQRFGGPALPFKTLTNGLDVEERVELTNEGPTAGTQCLPHENQHGASLLWLQPIEDIGNVDEIERLRLALKCLCHAANCPKYFGHAC